MRNCKFTTYHLLLLLVLLLALGLRGYRAMGKDSLFTDENLSIVLSNYGTYGYAWPAVAADDEIKSYEGSALRERIFKDDNSLQNILYDIWNLRKSTRDTPHTNLYYSCLRLSFWGADTTDLSDVVARAVLLNILVFSLGFFFLYRLSKLLFYDNMMLILYILAVYAVNPISASNTIFMREYQLQETMFVIFTYFVIACAKKLNDSGELFSNKKQVLGFLLVAAISFLPGYFGLTYVLMMWGGLGLFVLLKSNNKYKTIAQLIGVFVGSVIFLFILYPAYLDGFSGDRGEQAAGKLSIISLVWSLGDVFSNITAVTGVEIMILLSLSLMSGLVFLYVRRKHLSFERIATSYIILCAVVWLTFTFYLAPVKEVRYIASIFPLLYLIFPFALSFFANKKIQLAGVVMLIALFGFKSITEKNVYWGKVDVGDYYRNDVNSPLIIAGVYSPWLQTSLTPYFTDGRTIEFTFSEEEFSEKVNQYNEVYVILGGENMTSFSIPKGYMSITDGIFKDNRVEAVGGVYKIRKE